MPYFYHIFSLKEKEKRKTNPKVSPFLEVSNANAQPCKLNYNNQIEKICILMSFCFCRWWWEGQNAFKYWNYSRYGIFTNTASSYTHTGKYPEVYHAKRISFNLSFQHLFVHVTIILASWFAGNLDFEILFLNILVSTLSQTVFEIYSIVIFCFGQIPKRMLAFLPSCGSCRQNWHNQPLS